MLILPGREGKIKVVLSTNGYGGINLKKLIKIHTNDIENPVIKLLMTGDVKKFVLLEPEIISLKGKAGKPIVAQMKIIPTVAQDFNILKTFVKNGKDITFKVEKMKNETGAYFILTVHNKKQTPGRFFDMITLQPDLSPQRLIKIRVSANISN